MTKSIVSRVSSRSLVRTGSVRMLNAALPAPKVQTDAVQDPRRSACTLMIDTTMRLRLIRGRHAAASNPRQLWGVSAPVGRSWAALPPLAQRVPAASRRKIAILIACLRLVASGRRLDLEQRVIIEARHQINESAEAAAHRHADRAQDGCRTIERK
jgi:hypothetical protein